MSSQVLSIQKKKELPTIVNTSWTIYHLDGATMCRQADTFVWNFGVNNEVQDQCDMSPYNVWKGTWKDQEDGYKITITATTNNTHAVTVFDVIFVTPNVFIALLDGNVKYSGIRRH